VTRIYRYIVVHDSGMAPCPADGLVTLGTCKPVIRRCARPGDWVLGFMPGSLARGLMCWGGQVERVMSHADYERAFRGRPDAVYRETSEGGYERLSPGYHPAKAEMDRDTSAPVLVFDPARSVYLGAQPTPLPSGLVHLAPSGRGHRVNGTEPGDAVLLEKWIETTMPGTDRRLFKRPRHSGSRPACSPLPSNARTRAQAPRASC
jgi:hypothetical protein